MNDSSGKSKFSQNRNVILPLIIISNLFPLYGVINYNWTIFSVVYIYWIELLIISTFQLLKILISQGDSEATTFKKMALALQFFLIRTGLFLFYLLFIVIFLGFLVSAKNNDVKGTMTMFDVIFFKGSFYKITLLSFLLYNFIEFLVLFILNDQYKKVKPSDYNALLDMHILVVHIVVVLGTFIYMGATEKLLWNHKNAMIACVSLFVVVKITADFMKQSISSELIKEEPGKFI